MSNVKRFVFFTTLTLVVVATFTVTWSQDRRRGAMPPGTTIVIRPTSVNDPMEFTCGGSTCGSSAASAAIDGNLTGNLDHKDAKFLAVVMVDDEEQEVLASRVSIVLEDDVRLEAFRSTAFGGRPQVVWMIQSGPKADWEFYDRNNPKPREEKIRSDLRKDLVSISVEYYDSGTIVKKTGGAVKRVIIATA